VGIKKTKKKLIKKTVQKIKKDKDAEIMENAEEVDEDVDLEGELEEVHIGREIENDKADDF
jgi:hypothetical protein